MSFGRKINAIQLGAGLTAATFGTCLGIKELGDVVGREIARTECANHQNDNTKKENEWKTAIGYNKGAGQEFRTKSVTGTVGQYGTWGIGASLMLYAAYQAIKGIFKLWRMP